MTILAIDLGKFKSVCCFYEKGSDKHSFKTLPTTAQVFHDLFVSTTPEAIIIEACSTSGWIYDLATSLGFTCIVANPNGAAWQWKAVKRKTDKDDAIKLARLYVMSQIETVHMPTKGVRQHRGLIQHREKAVSHCTSIKNAIRALLDSMAIPWPIGAKGFSIAAREDMRKLTKPMMDCDMDELWKGRLEMLIIQLELAEQALKLIENKLNQIAAGNKHIQRLCTVPYISERTAETIATSIDDPHRFRNVREVGCYAGLTPKQHESSTLVRHGRISKRGPATMRKMLLNVTWGLIRTNEDVRNMYHKLGGNIKGKKKRAAIALCRKILTWCWAMMRDETEWCPSRIGTTPT